jgi:hypothetical protein
MINILTIINIIVSKEHIIKFVNKINVKLGLIPYDPFHQFFTQSRSILSLKKSLANHIIIKLV